MSNSERFQIRFSDSNYTLKVFNFLGKEVPYESNFSNGIIDVKTSMDFRGYYFIKLETRKGIKLNKISIE